MLLVVCASFLGLLRVGNDANILQELFSKKNRRGGVLIRDIDATCMKRVLSILRDEIGSEALLDVNN